MVPRKKTQTERQTDRQTDGRAESHNLLLSEVKRKHGAVCSPLLQLRAFLQRDVGRWTSDLLRDGESTHEADGRTTRRNTPTSVSAVLITNQSYILFARTKTLYIFKCKYKNGKLPEKHCNTMNAHYTNSKYTQTHNITEYNNKNRREIIIVILCCAAMCRKSTIRWIIISVTQ